MTNIVIDFSKQSGTIKPLHGVGGGPLTQTFDYDTTSCFQAAGIPYSRTHDIEYPYGAGEFVDIHCLFPNFDAPVDDPASYHFALTDIYIKAIVDAGTQVFYRLGESIDHQPVKRYVFPPKDYHKWAQICEHIILHYNEGWADGFHFNIQYWEIWNEPDLDGKMCWQGDIIEFAQLYTEAATYLKEKFPHLKIGGCAFKGPDNDQIRLFFDYITPRKVPMDFYSWHAYWYQTEGVVEYARKAQNLLKEYGYKNAESILNEWNYVVDWGDTEKMLKALTTNKSERGAAFCAAMMTAMQNTSVDKAMYYDVQMNSENWNGLFSKKPGGSRSYKTAKERYFIEKPFYSFQAFGELYRLGAQVDTVECQNDLYVLAASNGKKGAVLITCYYDDGSFSDTCCIQRSFSLDLTGIEGKVEYYLTDQDHTFEKVSFSSDNITLNNYSVLYIAIGNE